MLDSKRQLTRVRWKDSLEAVAEWLAESDEPTFSRVFSEKKCNKSRKKANRVPSRLMTFHNTMTFLAQGWTCLQKVPNYIFFHNAAFCRQELQIITLGIRISLSINRNSTNTMKTWVFLTTSSSTCCRQRPLTSCQIMALCLFPIFYQS